MFQTIEQLKNEYPHLFVEHGSHTTFCSFLDQNLVDQVVFNNFWYFVAYMVAGACFPFIWVRVLRKAPLLFSFLWLGVGVFVLWCGSGHKFRQLIYSTQNPYWFYIEANSEFYGAMISMVVASGLAIATLLIYSSKDVRSVLIVSLQGLKQASVERLFNIGFIKKLSPPRKPKPPLLKELRNLSERYLEIKDKAGLNNKNE